MKKYIININVNKYYDDEVKELIENKVSEYISLDEAIKAWSDIYFEYAEISFDGDATSGEDYLNRENCNEEGRFYGLGYFAYEKEDMTYVVEIIMHNVEGEIVDIYF